MNTVCADNSFLVSQELPTFTLFIHIATFSNCNFQLYVLTRWRRIKKKKTISAEWTIYAFGFSKSVEIVWCICLHLKQCYLNVWTKSVECGHYLELFSLTNLMYLSPQTCEAFHLLCNLVWYLNLKAHKGNLRMKKSKCQF